MSKLKRYSFFLLLLSITFYDQTVSEEFSIFQRNDKKKPLPWLSKYSSPIITTSSRERGSCVENLSTSNISDLQIRGGAASFSFNISKIDFAMFFSYFCNMAVLNFSVLTIPQLASEHFSSSKHISDFVVSVTAIQQIGGVIGKIINGFIVQKLGGKIMSWTYLSSLSVLSLGLSAVRGSTKPVGIIMMGYEYLSSIQWTSLSNIMEREYANNPDKISRGITIISFASTFGAITGKIVATALLNIGDWRLVSQFGSIIGFLGASSIYFTIPKKIPTDNHNLRHINNPTNTNTDRHVLKNMKKQNLLKSFKSVIRSKLYWQISIAHSLGYIARASDRILVPFYHEFTSLPQHVCGSLTSSISIGLFFGVIQGGIFSQLKTVDSKIKMLRNNYRAAFVGLVGLTLCGGKFLQVPFKSPYLMASFIGFFSCLMAAGVSLQFYQLPNLVSATMFPENSSVSLSLIDAGAYFGTSLILGVNKLILSTLGWSASWGFLAVLFGILGATMIRAIQPVLVTAQTKI